MKKHIRIIFAVLLTLSMIMLAGCSGGGSEEAEAPESSEPETTEASEAADPVGIHHAEIVIKDYGTVSLELDGDTAPITVQNFMDLANDGFYDGLTFHRIIDGFMIQGGDPEGNGTGGSGKNITGEFEANGYANDIAHTKGVISMARAQDPDSASSQFFIMVADAPHLDGQYAAFGHVTSGQDVVDKIAADARPLDDNGTIAAEDQPVIESVKIID
jgi:peptidyl-prolyl cis-trans isomerase B (cyclophilin B)